jgi:hypothetical protein
MSIVLHEKAAPQPTPSWMLLTILEPRLLLEERKLIEAKRLSNRAFQATFRSVRQRISQFVGWASGRRDPVLRSSDAYHAAIDRMLTIAQQSHRRLGRCA